MRRTIQLLSLSLFTALFLMATYRLPQWLPADLYLRLDPLLGINAVLTARQIIPRVLVSLIVVAATLACGRIFCAYVCPLGAIIDLTDPVLAAQGRRIPDDRARRLRQVKYLLLAGVLGSALVGVSLAYLIDPLALLTRAYAFVLHPLLVASGDLLVDLVRPLAGALGWTGLSHLSFRPQVFHLATLTLLFFAGVLAAGFFARRFWCRYLCPLGALLGVLSIGGFFRRRVSDRCSGCLACQKACPMGAIGDEPAAVMPAECIRCRICSKVCPSQAVAFPVLSEPPFGRGSLLPRRIFLTSLAGGAAFGAAALKSPFSILEGKREIIRPPGALPEGEFMRTCIRCGECMKSCVTNTLQPSLWEAGLLGLWTPKMELRLAACEPNCNVCGRVCPTQAIRSLPLEEKTYAKIGTAVLFRERCIVWAQDRMCLICDEVCPYNAVVFRQVEGRRRPFVVASRCNGCGYCQQRCPVEGEAAIVVMAAGEVRLRKGSYVAEGRRRRLEFRPDPGDDIFLIEDELGRERGGGYPAGGGKGGS